ncbi:GntR family transcriptional regulator [Hyphococcus sp.]|uniref:GntR family transcriptional regulator n=1 Tax=Hyphococcus sp. TaxID=2038636 RepID=UPI003D0C8BF7
MPKAEEVKPAPSAEQPSSVERVASWLRHKIYDGEFTPGQRLIEAELTEQFSVGRSTIREVIRRLTAEGLIETRHHYGARVRRFTRADVTSIYQVRQVIEGLAVRLTTHHLSENGRTSLRGLSDELSAAKSKGDIKRYIELNGDLHDFFVDESGNPFIAEIAARLNTRILRLQFKQVFDLDNIAISHADHCAILNAVLRGDAYDAELLMRAHIGRSQQQIESYDDSFFQ